MLKHVLAPLLAGALLIGSVGASAEVVNRPVPSFDDPSDPGFFFSVETEALTEESAAERVLRVAREEVGYHSEQVTDADGETKNVSKYGEWYDRPYAMWCDMFVSYCIREGGLSDYPIEYSCTRHELLLKEAGYWRDWNAYIPSPGDLVFFTGEGRDDMLAAHAGIVEEVLPPTEDEPARMITIEGNVLSTGSVARMTRTFDRVIGYGTYTVGRIYEDPTNDCRSPFTFRYNTAVSEPDWEVLQFIGADRSLYAYMLFPELVQLPVLFPAFDEDEPAEPPVEDVTDASVEEPAEAANEQPEVPASESEPVEEPVEQPPAEPTNE